ncbi:unnamed protein product, partial [Thlaspi arvense]
MIDHLCSFLEKISNFDEKLKFLWWTQKRVGNKEMATSPAQPPVTNSPPSPPLASQSPPMASPSPPVASPQLNISPPSSNATSPPSLSPPPSATPPPETSPLPPSPPPPNRAPPPVTTSSPPPPIGSPPPLPNPPEGSPPPPQPVVIRSPPPSISPPPPSPSVQPPQASSPPPLPSSPPPPSSVPPPRPSPSSPISQRSPPPPSNRPIQSPPPSPSPPSKPPTSSPPPPSPSPPSGRPTSSPPPSPPSDRPTSSPPPPPSRPPGRPTSSPPPPSPPSDSSPSPTFSLPTPSLVPNSDSPPQNNPTPSAPDASNSTHSSGIGTGAVVGISVAVALVVFSLIGLFVWCVRRREKRLSAVSGGNVTPSSQMSSSSPRSDSAFFRTQSSAPVVAASKRSGSHHTYFSQSQSSVLGNSKALFSYEELVKATNGFSQENLLGEGGFGCVYKGMLPDGRVVAVKQLKIGGGQGDREFKSEVETLSRIHHRHLVSIVGHCISGDRRLLIYDYVSNNDLYFHLHTSKEALDWATRVKIAAGAARGLAYLHEDCHPRIIHRDIKSSNILLEDNFDARVSDFGLARLALDCNTHITTRARPLVSHAIETGEFESLADPKLGGKFVESEMFRMIEAAGSCVRHSAAKRPRMGQIVRAFESLAGEDLTNGMRLGESEIFDSAQQSAEIRLFRRMAFGSQNYSTDFFTHSSYNSRDEHV